MKNNYKLLNQDDDLENNLENNLENDLSCQNHIELSIKKSNNNKDDCSICLEPNDSTSVELECGCGNKFHINCAKILKKNKIKKCPICQKKINDFNERFNYHRESITKFIMFSFILLIIPYGISCFYTFVINPICYILIPTELTYCDNIYYKCEYYPARVILFNNTINEKFNDFEIEYELLSSYEYIDKKTKQNKTCINLESHKFTTYQKALEVSKKSIGMKKDIFIPLDNDKPCKLHYKFYNPKKFILNILTLLNFIWLIPISIFVVIINYCRANENSQNINKFLKILFAVLFHLVIFIHFVLELTYYYYMRKLL